MQGLPTVRIDDLIMHPRDDDLIVGTHGRSIWIMDDISALEQMTDATMTTDAALFDVRPAVAWMTDIQKRSRSAARSTSAARTRRAARRSATG